uniref:Uncharacterized protein n=1 Tax=Romanomermis culicivorax TaxID=13658 RepID=A0A915KUM1_ROMCU
MLFSVGVVKFSLLTVVTIVEESVASFLELVSIPVENKLPQLGNFMAKNLEANEVLLVGPQLGIWHGRGNILYPYVKKQKLVGAKQDIFSTPSFHVLR